MGRSLLPETSVSESSSSVWEKVSTTFLKTLRKMSLWPKHQSVLINYFTFGLCQYEDLLNQTFVLKILPFKLRSTAEAKDKLQVDNLEFLGYDTDNVCIFQLKDFITRKFYHFTTQFIENADNFVFWVLAFWVTKSISHSLSGKKILLSSNLNIIHNFGLFIMIGKVEIHM